MKQVSYLSEERSVSNSQLFEAEFYNMIKWKHMKHITQHFPLHVILIVWNW